MMLKYFLSAAFLFLLLPPALRAQDASLLGAGTRVKLVTPALEAAQQTGTVVAATRDTITFRSDGYPVTRSLAVADLTAIQISGGKETHRGRDALYGLAIGEAYSELSSARSLSAAWTKPSGGSRFENLRAFGCCRRTVE